MQPDVTQTQTTMTKKTFDPSSLQTFGNAAAGQYVSTPTHSTTRDEQPLTMTPSDGVLSDPSGAVVVKPCTQAEIAFYESIATSHPDLAPHLPTFMGTLQLSADQQASSSTAADSGTIQTATGIERLHGKKLATELHIVLENITHGFKKPNVLDLKLGKQLWDEAAKPEKRARLDAVSNASTSSSLGFRIAGMRTYVGETAQEVPAELKEFVEKDSSGYWVYNKMYGRKFNTSEIEEGFWAYVLPQGKSEPERERARDILSYFLSQVQDIQKSFESMESRMYGASILFVYEGDMEEYQKTKKTLADYQPTEDDDDDEEDLPKLAAVKMIDFAHATWHPGQGSDENAIRGMRSTNTILSNLLKAVEKELE
jgi:1D-myo-inositol-tetrakisphosphate 5-kinase/inositol-polyphosphate multikinase